jgi:phosphatidylglycerophosphate synthase
VALKSTTNTVYSGNSGRIEKTGSFVPETKVRDTLEKSIVRIVVAYFLMQLAIFGAFGVAAGFLHHYGLFFLGASSVFHGVLLVMLLLFKQDFVIETTGEKLDKVNRANRITLLRVSTLPTLLFLVIAARDYRIRTPLLVLVVLVFLTDFADGYVSRKEGEVTRVGKMMDSASDYSLIIVLTVVFYYFHLIPRWLFALIVGRLLLQACFMAILILVKKRIEPRSTFMGKAAVASIMVLYAIEVLKLVMKASTLPILRSFEWIVGGIVAASVVDKIVAFIQDFNKKPKKPQDDGVESA